MATNLVKWWKTRFLNGYKQFTVLMPGDSASESGRETEELLSCHSAPLSPPPLIPEQASMPLPQTQQDTSCCCGNQPDLPRRELKFEEFECDVAVEGNDEVHEIGVAQSGEKCRQCGPPRQEFSFTLYDLDGHGKITKEDIAGLVTTIYDTLGATIQVPNSGSKTIRVRLTVAPENRSDSSTPQQTTPQNSKTCQNKNLNNICDQPAEKLTKESLHRNLGSVKLSGNAEQLYLNLSPCKKVSVETALYANVNHLNNNSTKEDIKRNNNETGHSIVNNTPHIAKKISRHESLRRDRLPNPKVSALATGASVSTPNSPLRNTSTPKATYGMHSPRCGGRKSNSHNPSPNRPRRRATFTAPAPPPNPPENINQDRAYSGTLQRQELLHIIQTNMEKNLLALHHNSTHHRKRGEDFLQRQPQMGSPKSSRSQGKRTPKTAPRLPARKTTKTSVDCNNVLSCSHYYLDLAGMEEANLCSYCDRGDLPNQHVLRHKTRELDHARAMAQVVEWLQGGRTGGGFSLPPKEPSLVESEDEDSSDAPTRLTHRHIHEHVHHHYHHYTENDNKKQ
ncbi:protein naked cuticle isoform X2 [Neocloeon triangulifer]|uniref:protein naked cuticle isoform X2 n=1 Tax=Neocloeon triangulifer TaxID=2078957 RepID=UPI00286F283B|nr:protein naked cuticle isoform X2 [Neocloeon triangulifer]